MGGIVSTTYYNNIEYITIGSTGNTTDFGDLSGSKGVGASCSSNTIAVFAGGTESGGYVNTIDQVTIASTGNATDFGDLLAAGGQMSSASNCHGGVQ